MFLPINGRIAIIDDEIKEVQPLFQIFSKYRVPYIFFNPNEREFIPEEFDETNDIRLLFLDLNFLDKTTQDVKTVKSILYSNLKRIISKNNFPYLIILWSTQEGTYYNAVKEIFAEQLSDRAPIGIEKFVKSDYIDHDGNIIKNGDLALIEKINEIFKANQSYSTLVYWENKVHKSADEVLQNIFHSHNKEWNNTSNFIVEKLGRSYLGKKKYTTSTYIDRTKGSLHAFNSIFFDSLETNINLCSNLKEQPNLIIDTKKIDSSKIVDTLNSKFLFSKSDLKKDNIDYTGNVCEDISNRTTAIFDKLFEDIISEQLISAKIKRENPDISDDSKANKLIRKEILEAKKSEIKSNIQNVYIVITPLCDYIQHKQLHIRLLKGIIINKVDGEFIHTNEATYQTPAFFDEDRDSGRILVTNFKHFFTIKSHLNVKNIKGIEPIFRLRGDIIADIKSKLARHVTRQGILFIE